MSVEVIYDEVNFRSAAVTTERADTFNLASKVGLLAVLRYRYFSVSSFRLDHYKDIPCAIPFVLVIAFSRASFLSIFYYSCVFDKLLLSFHQDREQVRSCRTALRIGRGYPPFA